jgi:hypothetical protein
VSFGEAKRWKKRGVVDYIYLENHRFKRLNFQYIYRISYKIAKKGNPPIKDLPH